MGREGDTNTTREGPAHSIPFLNSANQKPELFELPTRIQYSDVSGY